MRDVELYGMFRDLEKQMGSDVGQLLRVVSVMETRQKALERLLFSGRLQLLKLVLLQLLSPKMVTKALMLNHGQMLKEYQAKMNKAVDEKKKGLVSVSGPVIALASCVMLMFSGCVSSRRFEKVQAQLGYMTSERDIAARTANYCTEQQVKLIDVLQKFNQVDAAGNLRGKKAK